VVVVNEQTGELKDFNVMVGGGMGRTHNKEATFARAADHMGFVPKDDIYELTKSIIATQRDHGNREVRANARMKYLVHNLSIAKFTSLVGLVTTMSPAVVVVQGRGTGPEEPSGGAAARPQGTAHRGHGLPGTQGHRLPALSMCGLAVTEAERRMPDTLEKLRVLLDSLGLDMSSPWCV